MNLHTYLTNKIKNIISSWNENDIYVVSLFINSNETYEYKGISNVTELFISFNAEKDCIGLDTASEERWDYTFWRHNETPIIKADNDDEGMSVLFDWYAKQGITNIGSEDLIGCYDEEMRYIGKGPIGYYELLTEVVAVAKELQENGYLKDVFGRPIPIIVYDLEYPWYIIEANKQINIHDEARMYFAAMSKMGVIDSCNTQA